MSFAFSFALASTRERPSSSTSPGSRSLATGGGDAKSRQILPSISHLTHGLAVQVNHSDRCAWTEESNWDDGYFAGPVLRKVTIVRLTLIAQRPEGLRTECDEQNFDNANPVAFMSQPDSASSAAANTASVGSLAIGIRRMMQPRRTIAILAASTLTTICAGLSLPRNAHLRATQLPQVVTSDSAVIAPGDGFLEIVPRGRDVNDQRLPARRRAGSPATARLDLSQPDGPIRTASAHRAVLQRPDFGSVQLIDSATVPVAVLPQAQFGHSGFSNTRGGYNNVEASIARYGIPGQDERQNAAGGSTSALTIPDTQPAVNPQTLPEQPSTPVPAVPLPVPVERSREENASRSNTQPSIPEHAFAAPEESPTDSGHEHSHSGNVFAPQPRISAPFLGHSGRGPYPGTSGFRATVESDAPGWIGPYMGRTNQLPAGTEPSPTPNLSIAMPMDYQAWWDPFVRESAGIAPTALPVDVAALVQKALVHSPQVQVLQADPEVLQRIVQQEEAAFDWRAYLESQYDDLNDPIGNTLTTGNTANRFGDNRLNAEGGFKRKTESGGEFRIDQQVGHQYNNSLFLLPNPQSTSRLELSFRQPLLSRSGTVYNQNQIILARINTSISGDATLTELQSHLYKVTDAYWKLYRARAEFFQRRKFLTSAQKVLTTLDGRNQVDAMPRQILRARAAVARAESRMQRAVSDIRNAESQLRLLVNAPEMLNSGPVELTPSETPAAMPSPTGLRDSLQTALVNRPDISRAIREMRASGVRIGVSRSELLPKLDFIVSSYVAGLQNRTQIADSIGNQFTDGRPGFTIGLEFEVPLGNRAARAKLEQRQWELKRAISSFRATVETSLTEVEIASREVDTAYREMLGKFQAMLAAQNEVSYLQDRFEVLPLAEESSMLLLEDLLDGYERLADEESAFVLAQTNYALAIIQLRRATGTLLRSRYETPQLDPEESQWMASRADQAANETAEKAGQTVSVRNERPLVDSGRTPASWALPVGDRSAAENPEPARPSVVPAMRQPITPGPNGGHSFGRYN